MARCNQFTYLAFKWLVTEVVMLTMLMFDTGSSITLWHCHATSKGVLLTYLCC